MGSTSVQLYAQEYFKSLNPIAERIGNDVAATISAYEDLWHTLTIKDQNQVLDETIIHPEAVLKYTCYPQSKIQLEHFPRLQLQTGYKYIIDDDSKDQGVKWRDEHSAPFSWMTRSQFNLSLIDGDDYDGGINSKPNYSATKLNPLESKSVLINDSFVDPPNIVLGGSSSKLSSVKSKLPQKVSGDENLLMKLKSKTAVLKIHSTLKSAISKSGTENYVTKTEGSEKEILVQPKVNFSIVSGSKLSKPVISKQVIAKPRTPPPPPPTKVRSVNESNSTAIERKALLSECSASEKLGISRESTQTHLSNCVESPEIFDEFYVNLKNPSKDVPKTGFDFLDNW